MQTTTIGVFKDRIDAEGALRELAEAGVVDTSVTYVDPAELEGRRIAKSSSSARLPAGLGLLGAVIGVLVGGGFIPAVPRIEVSGQLVALFGLDAQTTTLIVAAIVGAFVGIVLGILLSGAESNSSVESGIRKGSVLLTIHSLRGGIRQILQKYRVLEVREYMTPL